MNSSILDLNNDKIMREGQLKQLWNSQCSFKQALSLDLSDNQDQQKQLAYTKKTSDSEWPSQGSYMTQGSDLFVSVTLTTKFSCQRCRYDIDENAIITPCQHAFHQNCLKDLLNEELMKKEYYIKCTCGFELNQMLKIHYRKDNNIKIYEDILKFEIENIKKQIKKNYILECEGGPCIMQKYDEQLNLIDEDGWCNSFYINDLQNEGNLLKCVYCGKNLFNPLMKIKINNPRNHSDMTNHNPNQNQNQNKIFDANSNTNPNTNTNPKIKLLNQQEK